MKKSNTMIIVLGCICFLLITTSIARAENAESTVNQLSSELQQSGVVTRNDADAIKSPLKNMVEKGTSKEELRDVVTELSNKGVKGDDLKESVNSMNDLVNKGKNPREAGNIVSQAAAQAHAQGLKGKDLAAKVHEAVKGMQAEKRASIETKKEQKETRNVERGMGEGSGKNNSPGGGQGGGMGNMGGGHGHSK